MQLPLGRAVTVQRAEPLVGQRKARLLSALLVVMAVVFSVSDLASWLVQPGYLPPWYGYFFLFAAWLLNRRGRYLAAAGLTLATLPAVIFWQVRTQAGADARDTLSYLVVGVLVASLLLSVRGTVLFSSACLLGLLLLPLAAPAAVPAWSGIVSPLALVTITAGLAVVAIVHRNEIERDRQAVLRDGEERLRLALDAARMRTWELELPSGLLRWPAAPGPPGSPAGRAATFAEYLERVHPDDRPTLEAAVSDLRAGGMPRQGLRHRLVDGDAAGRWVELHGRLDRDERGEPCRVRGVAFDVTDRRRGEEEREALIRELERRNAEMERFSYTVSHDLKSPLITISSFAGLLAQDVAAGRYARVAQDAARITGATGKMHALLADLLELSRTGRIVNPPERLSLAEIVQEAAELAKGVLEARGVALHVEAGLPDVHGDRRRLVETVQNLLDNAARFMGAQPQPSVVVGAREQDGERVFFVRDNGIGIAARHHERVFGLFERLDPSGDGTGVGLAVARRVVEAHGGRLWVESAGEGQGATFCFTLPAPPR